MTDELIIRKEGRAGWITLNRPKALNALTHDMVRAIEHTLDAWRSDPSIELVLLDGAGPRAFCAGGDVKAIFDAAMSDQHDLVRTFLIDEYRLNAALAKYTKPVVSFLHGTVMGGGVGVGCHVAHRVIDPGCRIAMPECRIGLVPDVGSTLLLANAPGRIGEFMALTGAAIIADHAIGSGFADYLIPSSEWDQLKKHLCETGDCSLMIATGKTPTELSLHQIRDIERVFSQNALAEIVAEAANTEFIDGLNLGSPISLLLALHLTRQARKFDAIEDALEHEFRFMARATQVADAVEGIRAALIERDNQPHWRFASIADVASDLITGLTSPLLAVEQLFPTTDQKDAAV